MDAPLLVDMKDPQERTMARWEDIWNAGIAVYTLCTSFGLGGTANNLGKYYII